MKSPEPFYFEKEPTWIEHFRKINQNAFDEIGLPNKKNEYWKYTDLSALKKIMEENEFSAIANDQIQYVLIQKIITERRIPGLKIIVVIDGRYQQQYSEINEIGLEVLTLHEALSVRGETIKAYFQMAGNAHQYPFATLNGAFFEDGLWIELKQNLASNIQILSFVTRKSIHTRNIIRVLNRSELTIYEEIIHLTPDASLYNRAVILTLAADSFVNYIKLGKGNEKLYHLDYLRAEQAQNSKLTYFNFSLNSQFSRDDLEFFLNEKNAVANARGFYYTHKDNQYLDNHLLMHHQASHTESTMEYRGILKEKSVAVFQGGVLVPKKVQKIQSLQMNHNILLSCGSEVYSKPELSIDSDDVSCQHGATVGELDESILFYMRSRGMNLDEAKQVLLGGFIEGLVEQISNPLIKSHVQKKVTSLC